MAYCGLEYNMRLGLQNVRKMWWWCIVHITGCGVVGSLFGMADFDRIWLDHWVPVENVPQPIIMDPQRGQSPKRSQMYECTERDWFVISESSTHRCVWWRPPTPLRSEKPFTSVHACYFCPLFRAKGPFMMHHCHKQYLFRTVKGRTVAWHGAWWFTKTDHSIVEGTGFSKLSWQRLRYCSEHRTTTGCFNFSWMNSEFSHVWDLHNAFVVLFNASM